MAWIVFRHPVGFVAPDRSIACVIALILLMVRVRYGSVRHAAWTAVLCAMLLMPVLPYCLPTIAIPVLVPVAGGGLNAAVGDTRIDPVTPGGAQPLSETIAAAARPVSGRAAARPPYRLLRLVRCPVCRGRSPDSSCTAPAC